MNVQKIMQMPNAKKMYNLKLEYTSNILYGHIKSAKKVHKEFAKFAVNDFETFKQIPSPVKGKFSIFSKMGFNILRYLVYDLFSKDSIEEKQLKKMIEQSKKTT